MIKPLNFWAKTVGGLVNGWSSGGKISSGFDGALTAMKTAWRAGVDENNIYRGFRDARKQLKLKKGDIAFPSINKMENADKIWEYAGKNLNGSIDDATVREVTDALRATRGDSGYMNGFQRAGTVGIGYLGYKKLRNPSEDTIPLIPFL